MIPAAIQLGPTGSNPQNIPDESIFDVGFIGVISIGGRTFGYAVVELTA